MTNKFLSLFLLIAVVVGVGSVGVQDINAQTASFPSGCSSALGYSITTGFPCNGTSTATIGPLLGCTTALGYSVTNGAPCSGGPTAIFWLAGCTSVQGYSTIDGKACNGTAVAFVPPVVVIDPGTPSLPVTGAGGNAFPNLALLLVAGVSAVLGLRYLSRRPRNEA